MIYIIDASMYVFRAWFSIPPDSMIDAQKNPVNALYGFTRFLGDFLEEEKPDYVAVAFDESLITYLAFSIILFFEECSRFWSRPPDICGHRFVCGGCRLFAGHY